MFGEDGFMSFFGILNGLYTVTAFTIIYEDAFNIPLEAERVKMALTQQLSLNIGVKDKEAELDIAPIDLESICEECTGAKGIEFNDTTDTESDEERVLQSREHKELLKLVKSVPHMGIKAGEFQVFTRGSTTDFLAVVTQQVSSLLIAFH